MKAPVVADTTVWSNFSHAGQPQRVVEAFPSVASPRAVLAEIREGQRLGYLLDIDWSFVEEISLTAVESARAVKLETSLGAGEAACIAVSESRGGLLLTDDRAARKVAMTLGLPVSGTLGVLARLVTAGLPAKDADELLSLMIRCGYRSPVSSLSELL
jgi:predicted nucleic acid-binding protein